ncbi:MAG: hypothetical protein ABFS18_05625 [Thermodesulfobacteriota bacterium]
MNSLAIWYEGGSGKNIHLHINFWKLPSKARDSRFLDIGLNLPDALEIENIYIFIPFAIDEENIKDLGRVIAASPVKLLTAIFNEDYRITSSAMSDYYRVNDHSGQEVFNIYAMNETNFSLEKKHGGTVIVLSMPQKNIRQDKTYLRFRITGLGLAHFSRIEKDVSSILSSAFSKNEILDFRINSARHLPNKLLEEMSEHRVFDVGKIHFFYICSYCENYILSHQPFHSVRKLEDGIWKEYICATHNLQNISTEETFIAYHWKKKSNIDSKIEDFNVFLKTNFRDKNLLTIVKYVAFLLLFSVFAGLITNFIYSELTNKSLAKESMDMHDNTGAAAKGSNLSTKQLSVPNKTDSKN